MLLPSEKRSHKCLNHQSTDSLLREGRNFQALASQSQESDYGCGGAQGHANSIVQQIRVMLQKTASVGSITADNNNEEDGAAGQFKPYLFAERRTCDLVTRWRGSLNVSNVLMRGSGAETEAAYLTQHKRLPTQKSAHRRKATVVGFKRSKPTSEDGIVGQKAPQNYWAAETLTCKLKTNLGGDSGCEIRVPAVSATQPQ